MLSWAASLLRIACEGRTTLLGQSEGSTVLNTVFKSMKIGWVKKTYDAKSRRGMNKGTGFGPKNKPSLLCNGKGEGELAGSKKRCKEGPCPPLKAVFLTPEESDTRTQRSFCILDSAYSVQCQKFRAKISISA